MFCQITLQECLSIIFDKHLICWFTANNVLKPVRTLSPFNCYWRFQECGQLYWKHQRHVSWYQITGMIVSTLLVSFSRIEDWVFYLMFRTSHRKAVRSKERDTVNFEGCIFYTSWSLLRKNKKTTTKNRNYSLFILLVKWEDSSPPQRGKWGKMLGWA